MKKETYVSPQTCYTEVELESGFMNGSIIDVDKEKESTISIENQEVGAESNYFESGSDWDY